MIGRRLIVNADDFGMSDGVNKGIAQAHRRGIVTSASLMVRMPAVESAARIAAVNPSLGVGLHVDIGEWCFANGEWLAVYERAPVNDERAIRHEVEAQLEIFTALIGSAPTHLDSHQHAHRREPFRSIIIGIGDRLRLPVRHFTSAITYVGDFFGQDDKGELLPNRVSAAFLMRTIAKIGEGVSEICCHPASKVDFKGAYAVQRLLELDALCADSVSALLERQGIALCTFADVR